mgnify:CR=1 FL=1
MTIEERVSKETLTKLLKKELEEYGVNTPFEFAIYESEKETKVKSDAFLYDKNKTYSIPIYIDNEGNSEYKLVEGEVVVKVDPKYYRPIDIEHLIGDASKAKQVLGWYPKTSFKTLVNLMVANAINN